MEAGRDIAIPGQTSPLDLIRLMGGKARKVRRNRGKSPDSMLAVYGHRLTYTFIIDNEVASIHFDRGRGEIFYKGHNIKNLEFSEGQREAFFTLQDILQSDEEGREFLPAYLATLERCLADK